MTETFGLVLRLENQFGDPLRHARILLDGLAEGKKGVSPVGMDAADLVSAP